MLGHLLLSVGVAACVPTRAPAAAAQAMPAVLPPLGELETALLNWVNADRAARGISPVADDDDLREVARVRAAAQVGHEILSHFDAAGEPAILPLIVQRSVVYGLLGENLVRLPGSDITTAARAEEALMNSPLHRANILEPAYNRLAVGAASDSRDRVVFAQLLRGPPRPAE
jgi:uncharacterized protein YkwD